MAIFPAGTLLSGVTGKLGNIVIMTSKNGVMTVRERVTPKNPRTAGQMTARNNMGGVARLWGTLTDEQRADWEAYGLTVGRDGYRVFVGLTAKWRRINGNGAPPALPPTEAFFGDSVGLSVALGPVGSGTIVFATQRPNQPGVKVELMVQRLASQHRKAKPRDWKSYGFVAFAAGSLTYSLALPKGDYAVGYRYVNAVTGQETAMALLGKITVS